MANYKNTRRARKNGKGGNRHRKNSRYNELQKFAYKMGQVERGLKNPNSLISESFESGKVKREKQQKKSLF